jgi:hypothetical protein
LDPGCRRADRRRHQIACTRTSPAAATAVPCASSSTGMFLKPKLSAAHSRSLVPSSSVTASCSRGKDSRRRRSNQHLSAIRALADECAESCLLDQPTAAAIGRVRGVPIRGVRLGKWLTREQAEQLRRTYRPPRQPSTLTTGLTFARRPVTTLWRRIARIVASALEQFSLIWREAFSGSSTRTRDITQSQGVRP